MFLLDHEQNLLVLIQVQLLNDLKTEYVYLMNRQWLLSILENNFKGILEIQHQPLHHKVLVVD